MCRPRATPDHHRETILVAEFHARDPRLFGSVARGEDEAGSDVVARVIAVCDVLADISSQTDLAVFVDDTSTQWAVEMGLIRIGEGINRLDRDVDAVVETLHPFERTAVPEVVA